MKTYVNVSIIPEPSEIRVRTQPDIVSIELGGEASLIFSVVSDSAKALAALDALHEAITKAYELLAPATVVSA